MPGRLGRDYLMLEKQAAAPPQPPAGTSLIYPDEATGKWRRRDGDTGATDDLIMELTVQDLLGSTILQNRNTLTLPPRTVEDRGGNNAFLRLTPRPDARTSFWVNADNAGYVAVGTAAPTVNVTPTNSNDSDSAYVRHATSTTANTPAGIVSAAFTLTRLGYDPTFIALMRTDADVTNLRFLFGLVSAAPAVASDTITPTQAAIFRFSTPASDPGWMFVSSNGSGQTVTNMNVPVTTNTAYMLRFRVDSAAGKIFAAISVNRAAFGAEVEITSTLPDETQNLGYICRHLNTAAAGRAHKLSRMYIEMN